MINKASYVFARILSVVFHPLLVPTWAFILILTQGNLAILKIPSQAAWMIALLVFLCTAAIPAFIFLFMYRLKMISALSMPYRSERMAPIVVTAIFFYLMSYLVRQLHIAPVFGFYMIGATALALLCLVVNIWWKISLHLAGMGGVTGALAGMTELYGDNYFLPMIAALIISGFVAASRLRLNAHRPAEVYAGFALGVFTMYFLLSLVY